MLDGLFKTQETWAVPGEEGKQKLMLIAKQAGFSEEAFDKCVGDKELFDDFKDMHRLMKEQPLGAVGVPPPVVDER